MESSKPRRSSLKPEEQAWVFGTVCLITFLVFSLQITIIIPHFLYQLPLRREDAIWKLCKVLVPFNIGALGIYWNYYNCVSMDPGGIPKGWKPPKEVLQPAQDDEKEHNSTSSQQQVRYCKPCKAFKPPRTHHCRTCKRCVLRMDHHCPWVANCIGQRNYASFIRFLFCVDVTCLMHLTLLTARVADYWWLEKGGIWRSPSTPTMVMMVLNYAFCLPTLMIVGIFSFYHFWCLTANTTTIEGWEKDKVERMVNRGRIRQVDYPFDLGFIRNITSVLGRSPLFWCLPSETKGDGLRYDVGEEVDEIQQFFWPPKDPEHLTQTRKRSRKADTSGDPFTYGNGGFNPALKPSNALRQRSKVPPWHPDYEKEEEEDEQDSAQQAGVDLTDGCLPNPTNEETDSSAFAFMDGAEYDRRQMEEMQSDNESDEEGQAITSAHEYTQTRVRRGSEGYEVRPKRYDVAYAYEAEEEEQRHRLEWEDDSEGSEGVHFIGGDGEQDERTWLWRQQQEEEEAVRQQIQEEWRKELRERGLKDFKNDFTIQQDPDRNGTKPLLPSEIMQKRAEWQSQQTQ
ncbi:zf-DHHC-domain-containing protein [Meira miltonrushii]|uniref:Palmitoyltransferase PFA4 n=1 Tax=Meira miltonrushii TaxID=1280837 RepID=A0A316V4P8_9BASI|nr:zf-DHHC-domain-containing protein [Meira miltonrushii]PWN32432.1 zf-DHHC-domain-containing protein [Meira miltonrushii]